MHAFDALGGADGVFHQHAAAWPKFDPVERRLAQRIPFMRAPKADQFAKHLAGFRRCQKIRARAANARARRVIAIVRIVEARAHEFRNGEGGVVADMFDELF